MPAFDFRWNGAALLAAKDEAEEDTATKLASDIEPYLVANLHRYPRHQVHRLAAESFAEVGREGGATVVRFGSDAPYTIFHELFARNYAPHPQLRSTGDKFGAEVGSRLVAAFRARVR